MNELIVPSAETDREGWLKWRRGKLGGHAACTLMGENEYQTVTELYDRMVNGEPPISDEQRAFFDWRLELEDPIARLYAKSTGRKVRRVLSSCDPENERLIASPDRIISDDTRDDDGVLEVKSSDPMVYRKYLLRGAPPAFWIQVQHYLMITGYKWGAVVVGNVSSGQILPVEFEADLDFIGKLRKAELDFLDRVDRRDRPTEDAAAYDKLPALGGELVPVRSMNDRLIVGFKKAASDFDTAAKLKKQATEIFDMAKGGLIAWMDEAGCDVAEGFGRRVYYKEQKGKRTFDKKALQAAHPELDLSQFEKVGKPFRPLRMFTVKNEENANV